MNKHWIHSRSVVEVRRVSFWLLQHLSFFHPYQPEYFYQSEESGWLGLKLFSNQVIFSITSAVQARKNLAEI